MRCTEREPATTTTRGSSCFTMSCVCCMSLRATDTSITVVSTPTDSSGSPRALRPILPPETGPNAHPRQSELKTIVHASLGIAGLHSALGVDRTEVAHDNSGFCKGA